MSILIIPINNNNFNNNIDWILINSANVNNDLAHGYHYHTASGFEIRRTITVTRRKKETFQNSI